MDLSSEIDSFSSKNILVVGDVMLDKYIYGDVSRISPEAPIPIVKIENEDSVPGGAGNTANNVISLGANAFLVGVVGGDETRKQLVEKLADHNIDLTGVVIDKTRKTTVKTRVVGNNNHQLVRFDYENSNKISEEAESELYRKINELIDKIDIIVVSDYDKGVISENFMKNLKKIADEHNKKILVDPKPKNINFYKNVYLITPNTKESYEMSGVENLQESGQKLCEIIGSNVLVTRGSNGMSLFEKESKEFHIPTKASEVYDVSGAGDTVIAVMALSLASGLSLRDSAAIANHAAGIVVRKSGTASVTIDELKGVMQ